MKKLRPNTIQNTTNSNEQKSRLSRKSKQEGRDTKS